MSSAAAKVRNYIKSLDSGTTFTTSHVLKYGSRDAVDNALRRAVRKGLLRRLAAGVFISALNEHNPSAFEIANAKAAAFGKHISTPETVRTESQYANKFLTDGCKSSFNSIHGRLFFSPASPQRLRRASLQDASSQLSKSKDSPAKYGDLLMQPKRHLSYAKQQRGNPFCSDTVQYLPHFVQLPRNKFKTVTNSNKEPPPANFTALAGADTILSALVSLLFPRQARPTRQAAFHHKGSFNSLRFRKRYTAWS